MKLRACIPLILAGGLFLAGCLSPEQIRRIEGTPGQEGTGLTLSRLPAVIKIIATYEATPEQRSAVEQRARVLAESDTDLPRYIAVEAPPDDRLQGKSTTMLWDTQTEQIIGNKVYDIETPPQVGEVAMWETYSAQYVGAGLKP